MTKPSPVPFTMVDGFKVRNEIPDDSVLGAMGLPVLRAYARHFEIQLSTNKEELRAALAFVRDYGFVSYEDSAKVERPAEVPVAMTAPEPPVAKAGKPARAKAKAPPPEEPAKAQPASTSSEAAPIIQEQPRPSVDPLVVGLWKKGRAHLEGLLNVRWTMDKAVQYSKEHRLEALPTDLPHFMRCMAAACKLVGMNTRMEEEQPEPAPEAASVQPPVAQKPPAPKPTPAPKPKTETKDKEAYGMERKADLKWDAKKVALFRALSRLGASDPLSAVGTAAVVAMTKGVLTPRDVRHYGYHAKAGGLVGVAEAVGAGKGYSFYLTEAGQAIDPEAELAAGR